MAGDLSNANPNLHVRDTGTPILHIMETNDEYDPYPHSIQWDRDNLTAPRWMVSLFSSHVPPYTRPGRPDVRARRARSPTAFLDGTVKGHPERLDDVTGEVNAQPVGRDHRALSCRLRVSDAFVHRGAELVGPRDGGACPSRSAGPPRPPR